MTESRQSVSQDAQIVLTWLQDDIRRRGGSGRRPAKIQMGLGWWDEDEDRIWPAVRHLVEHGLVTLQDVGIPGMGPYVCPTG